MPTQAEQRAESEREPLPRRSYTSERFKHFWIEEFDDGSALTVSAPEPGVQRRFCTYRNAREANAAMLLEGMTIDMVAMTGATVVECRRGLTIQMIKLSVLAGQMTFDEGESKLNEIGETMRSVR